MSNPEILIFTATSLLIAITGASYGILMTVKESHKEQIDVAVTGAKACMATTEKAKETYNTLYKTGVSLFKKLNKFETCWRFFLTLPIYIFGLLMLSVSGYLIFFVSDPTTFKCGWLHVKIIIAILIALYILCYILALLFNSLLHRTFKALKNNTKAIQEVLLQTRLTRHEPIVRRSGSLGSSGGAGLTRGVRGGR